MTTLSLVALVTMVLTAVLSIVIGSLGVRMARTTSDFLVASRTVGPTVNASAISGEYLSYASFLGIAGLIIVRGADGLWYAVSFSAGYLALVLFVAAPLRRSGAYTIPDFAEARLDSPRLRLICAVIVAVIGWIYLLPQFQGAALALTTLTGAPAWVGVGAAALVVILAVVVGGMRSITFVQALQFWIKFTAVAVPTAVMLALFLHQGHHGLDYSTTPRFEVDTTVTVHTDVVVEITEPVRFRAEGVVDGQAVNGPVLWGAGKHEVASGARLRFQAGDPVPTPAGTPGTEHFWLERATDASGSQLLEIYAVLIAGFLGTMGMPHLLVRFYTNTDGRAARRTTVGVLAMIGGFYMLLALMGALSRVYVPRLLVTGRSDLAVMLVPSALFGDGWAAWLLAALISAGVAAAFLATSTGLVVSVAGVLSTDVLRGPARDFRAATFVAAAVPAGLAAWQSTPNFGVVVLVFALAAATFCPLLVLGIWWRGLTAIGAGTGVLVGAVLTGVSVAAHELMSLPRGWVEALLANPTPVTVPVAFLTMLVVSKLTRSKVPPDTNYILLRFHAPERLGLGHDRLSRTS